MTTMTKPRPFPRCENSIAKDPRNRERIFPYIGGEEVNDVTTISQLHRYVINFGAMNEAGGSVIGQT